MKLYFDQLEKHLQSALLPVYLVSGDEPFQKDQSAMAIRQRAVEQGFTEREVHYVDKNFDWDQLMASAGALSLFADKKLIDLRLSSGNFGDAGRKVLVAYCERPPDDMVLLITMGKMEKAQLNTKWFKAVDQVAGVLQIWPVEAEQMPAWIKKRMQYRGMQPTADATALLAEQLEGNLLAADQELEKLRLLCGEGEVDVDQVASAVTDSARFDVFALVDAALLGDSRRVVRILQGLSAEGVEPTLVLWALSREIRAMANMAWSLAQGTGLNQVLSQNRVWDKRKAPVTAGLKRYSSRRWQGLLYQAAEVERVIKGRATGAIWDELVQLSLKMAGINLIRKKSA
ncbi:MAG: DNA polymerase III subunit delta [Gammaproteobacteria bacterium]|nr:DNA polymerase III subunit delta [Gammaproteobacteria bacterium]